MGRLRLEDYNVDLQHFHDALNGLDTAIQEALLRCDKARLACREARLVCEREIAERASSPSLPHCPERKGDQRTLSLSRDCLCSCVERHPTSPTHCER